jgi:hypothetical protein
MVSVAPSGVALDDRTFSTFTVSISRRKMFADKNAGKIPTSVKCNYAATSRNGRK